MKNHFMYRASLIVTLIVLFLGIGTMPVLAGYRYLGLDPEHYFVRYRLLSPDASHVAVIIDNSLYLHSITDGASEILLYNESLFADLTNKKLFFTPDGQGLLLKHQVEFRVFDLYYISFTEHTIRHLVTANEDYRLGTGGIVGEPDDYRLFYTQILNARYDRAIYTVALNDGTITPFATNLPQGGHILVSPSQEYVIVAADYGFRNDPVFYVPIAGGPSQLIGTFNDHALGFTFSPDSRHIVFVVDTWDNLRPLYHYDTVTQVLTLLVPDYVDTSDSFQFTADSRYLYYAHRGLYAYDLVSHEQRNVYQSVNGGVREFFLAVDGHHILVQDRSGGGADTAISELYAMSVDTPTIPLLIEPNFKPTDSIQSEPLVTTTDGWVVYRTSGGVEGQDRLYAAPLDGSAPPVRRNMLGTVHYRLDPSGRYIYYREGNGLVKNSVIPTKEGPFTLYRDGYPTIQHIYENGLVYFVAYEDFYRDYVADGQSSAVSWQSAAILGAEGTTVEIPVTLDSASAFATTTLSIEVEAASATYGEDYTLLTNTLTFPPGTTRGVVPIQIMSDNEADSGEMVILRLTDPHGIRLTEPTTTTLTLYDTLYYTVLPAIRR